MNDFKLDEKGDIKIENNDISLVSGNDLIVQKIKQILGTNKGEWFANEDEGINIRAILAKNPNEDEIIDNVLDGLQQVDETFHITEYTFNVIDRKLYLNFKAETSSGEEVDITI